VDFPFDGEEYARWMRERHAGRVLERHYKATRYPDEYAAGTPRDHYDALISNEALNLARQIVAFVKATKEAL
jgi:HEPN domain-containing protein